MDLATYLEAKFGSSIKQKWELNVEAAIVASDAR